MLQRAYVPLMAREATGATSPLQALRLHASDTHPGADAAPAIEAGRALARDIGSADPERMAPLRLAELVRRLLHPLAHQPWTPASPALGPYLTIPGVQHK